MRLNPLEHRIRGEIARTLKANDFSLEDTLFYSLNLIQGMKDHLSSLDFFDREMIQRQNLPAIYKEDLKSSYTGPIASKALQHARSYIYEIRKMVADFPYVDEHGSDFDSLRIAMEFKRISWIVVEMIEDRYGVILDPKAMPRFTSAAARREAYRLYGSQTLNTNS